MRHNNLKQMRIAKALNREIIHKILIIYLQIQKKRVLNKENTAKGGIRRAEKAFETWYLYSSASNATLNSIYIQNFLNILSSLETINKPFDKKAWALSSLKFEQSLKLAKSAKET